MSQPPLELNGSEIAIVGMSCRFPGARTPDQFWKNLCNGVESMTRVTPDDLRRAGLSADLLEAPNYVAVMPALDDIEFFDAGFFGYTPLEARIMDPQQRLFLECAWEAFEQAGHVPDLYPGKIGVFTGAKTNTYLFNIFTNRDVFESLDHFQIALGNDLACMATRVAYKFDLRGPSYAIHTACSTSLVAVHLACQSLLLGECDMAIAGGAAINVPQRRGYFYQKGGILSPDGHCRTFDADAQGSNFGNGVGAVLIKRLEDAISQRDHIYAIIRGSASNNDGARKASYTAPGVEGQASVLLEAMACAGVEPDTISYIEAHGTATDLGDAIEMLALTEAFRGDAQTSSCAIGSVKTNVGHLETAAGVAGLIKTALALEHRQIPPSLHFERPNPKIDFAAGPFYVNTTLTDWSRGAVPRRAGVSSFGLGSSNAHVILEEAPPQSASGASRPWQLMVLSARSESALDAATTNLVEHLEERSQTDPPYIADVAYTLAVGRKSFSSRRVAVCPSQAETRELRESFSPSRALTQSDELANRRIVFLFPGLGDHYPGMGSRLYHTEPVFKEHVDRGAEIVRLHLGFDFREALFQAEEKPRADEGAASRKLDFRRMVGRSAPKEEERLRELNQTYFIQPTTFVVEYALARLWMSWGVAPHVMIGYSLGEYVAACLAGVLSLEDAIAVVAKRARMIQDLPEGAMLAVPKGEAELGPAMTAHGLSLAAVNGPAMCVLSGPVGAVDAVEAEFTAQGIVTRRLQTSHAFHSKMTEVLAEPLTGFVKDLQLQAPRIPYISNVTGEWIRAEDATDPAYWAKHMSGTVRFSEGIEEIFREKDLLFLEVGPGQGLTSLVKQHPNCDGETARLAFASLPGAYDGRPEPAFLLESLGKIWLAGHNVDWKSFYGGEERHRVPLPTYPFERERYWIDPPEAATATRGHRVTLEKKADIADWFYAPAWKPGTVSAAPDERPPSRWIVFIDNYGVGAGLIDRLAAAGNDVITVSSAEFFEQVGEREFTINPEQPNDYARLISTANEGGRRVGTIVHLWSVTSQDRVAESAGFERFQDFGFYSLLFLAQAAGRHALSDAIRIEVVTNGVLRVTGKESLYPEKATVLGPVRVIPQEFPKIECRCIDISLPGSDETVQADLKLSVLLDQLIGEFQSEPKDLLVAYRDETRWVQDFLRIPLAEGGQATRLRDNGVYVITGGLGGLGLVLAEHLAQSVKARLVLTSRSGLPDRSEWAGLLEPGRSEPSVVERIRAVKRLEELGAEALVVAADVSSESQMQRVLDEATARFGTIHGVVHLAGVPGGGIIQLKTREMAEQIIAPKVQGALILERLLKGRDLDFLVLYSSIASILGEFGQADYCAANAFLDALAQRNALQGGPHTAVINWDIWREVGLAVYTEVPGHLREWRDEMLEKGIRNTEGVEAFDRILASGLPQVIVSAQDLPGRIELGRSFTGKNFLEELQKTGASHPRPARRVLGTNYVAASGDLEQKIAEVWQRVLGADQIGMNDNFFDLGGNSLLGLQLVSELSRELGMEIAPVTLFEFATVSALARHLNPQTGEIAEESANRLKDRRSRAKESAGSAEIAIIGMGGRFPGAPTVEALWRNLCDGVESVTFFDDEELLASGVSRHLFNNPRYVKAGAILEEIDQFDAGLFGFSPREAEVMDPQHRIFLECAWEVLESAGYDPASYKGLVGVFAGSNLSTYLLMLHADPKVRESVNMLQAILGNDKDSLTTSVSYKLNLRGPSIAVQTFCSTSLVAVHMACQSLRTGECDMALAGGIRVVVPDRQGYLYESGGLAPSDGHTRSFDAAATGSILGNGVGIVLLKRLEDALADGDHISAVIKGSAINNDGSMKAGYTAPSVAGQSEAIVAALDDAGVEPDSISYIEAHGSATELGDPIEVAALTKAFRTRTDAKNFCGLGSVKSNFGHLDRAAGVAALIKTAMALERRQIPPSINFAEPNPKIDFANSPFYVNTVLRDWLPNGKPLRAGVNSLGMGGTNAHVILEEAPPAQPSTPGRPWQLLVLSARTEKALETATQNLGEHLKRSRDVELADVAYTLQLGRRALDFRRSLVCRDIDDAIKALAEQDPRRVQTAYREEGERPIVFMFPGLGGQYVNMGRGLYDSEPLFRQEVDRCSEILARYLGFDLRKELYPESAGSESNGASPRSSIDMKAMLGRRKTAESDSKLDRTSVSQPVLFVIEYALARLWMGWGIRPHAMVGYSLGEYVAACLAGVFSLEDALKLVAERAKMIESLPPGALLAVGLSEDEISPLLNEELSIMAVNGPAQCVASGPPAAIEELQNRLEAGGAVYRRLQASHAFHSRMMAPIFDSVVELAGSVELGAPQIPYLSNVTGKWIRPEEATEPAYWARHMCQPVRFSDGVDELLRDRRRVFLEAGPPLLSSLIQQHPEAQGEEGAITLNLLRHSYETVPDLAYTLQALGKLWLLGAQPDWETFHADERRRRLSLPTYPFQRQRYWIDAQVDRQYSGAAANESQSEWFYVPSWTRSLPAGEPNGAHSDETPVRWWILMDEGGLGEELAARLESPARYITRMRVGDAFNEAAPGAFVVRPDAPQDFVSVLDIEGGLPDTVVHLWGLPGGEQQSAQSNETAGACAVNGVGALSLLTLSEALRDPLAGGSLKLWVVSDRLHEVTGEEILQPEQTDLLGASTAIARELPGLRIGNLDVVRRNGSGGEIKRLAHQLSCEMRSASQQRVVAYRGGHRWVPTLAAAGAPATNGANDTSAGRRSWLIINGLNTVGFSFCDYLSRTSGLRLTLVEPPGFPQRELWDEWLANDTGEGLITAKIKRIRAIEEHTEIRVIGTDLCNVDEVRSIIAELSEPYGLPLGVLYVFEPGVSSAADMQSGEPRLARSRCENLFVLDEVLREHDLAFRLLVSQTRVSGRHSAADDGLSLFLDSFAANSARNGHQPWTSVTWHVEGHVPGQMAGEVSPEASTESGSANISDAIGRLLHLDRTPHVIVSLHPLAEGWNKVEALMTIYSAAAPVSEPIGHYPRPSLRVAYVPPTTAAEQTIVGIWRELLGVDKIGIHDNFLELGGDSLLAVRLISRLRDAFQQELPISLIFEASSIAELARAVEQKPLDSEPDIDEIMKMVEQLSEEDAEQELLKRRHSTP